MRGIFLVYLIGIVLSEVTVLTDENFEETINKGKPVLVKFLFATESESDTIDKSLDYNKLAEKLANEDYIIAYYNATVHNKTVERLGIKEYPAVILFNNKTIIRYTGNYEIDDMIQFIKERIHPLNTKKELENVINARGNHCILVSDREEDKEMIRQMVDMVKEFAFYYTNEEIAGMNTETPYAIILRDFEERQIIYNRSLEQLKDFLIEHSHEYVKVIDLITSIGLLSKKDQKLALLITPKEEDKHIIEVFRSLAISRQSSEFIFGKLVKKNEDWSKKLIKYFRITDKDIPRIEIVDLSSNTERPKRYLFEGKIELGELERFIDDYKRGDLKEFIEPEAEPEPEYVKELVTDTFKNEVFDNDDDVLVYFYSDDCGFCSLFNPIYKASAETLKDNKKLRILKINGVKNRVQGVFVNSYPTVYLYPAGKKDYPIPFNEDEKTKRSLIVFLKKYCAHSVYEIKEDL